MGKLAAFGIGLLLMALASAAGASPPGTEGPRLRSFGSCAELLSYAKENALPLVGPWGIGGGPIGVPSIGEGTVIAAPGSVARSAGAPDYSTTNVQEEGVDEPDMVKTDGSRLFTVARGKLHALDVRADRPRLLGSLPLAGGGDHEVLLHGKRLLVLSRAGYGVVPIGARVFAPDVGGSVLTEVDVSEPAAMRVVRTLTLEGTYLSARAVGGAVRVVVSSSMPRELSFPPTPSPLAPAEAMERNRAVVAASRLSSWLPTYTVRSKRHGTTKKRALVQCRDVRRPAGFSGLGLLAVLTIDLERGLEPVDSDALLSDGRVVYGSTRSLYVATQRWTDRPDPLRPSIVPLRVTTALHRFDVSQPQRTEYRASGEAPGFLLNQWSLSEHEGVLRVATTEMPAWSTGESESFVTTLRQQGNELIKAGQVGGLGRGERIYAVRFMGDVGYVVTFRQVDPLYALDLSKPERPTVLGELKIAGYSAYLHPVGEDTILGLGQDADERGRVRGTQLSLFDVSDLRRPAKLHGRAVGPSFSEAEFDHHAFLYWNPSRLVVVPVQLHTGPELFSGAIAFRVSRAQGVEEVGRISHAGAPVRRSLVVGDALLTVSEAGVKASALRTLADRGGVTFQ